MNAEYPNVPLDHRRCHYPTDEEMQCKNEWMHFAAGMKLCTKHLAMLHEWAHGDQIVVKRKK